MKQGRDYAARRGEGSIEERRTKAGDTRFLARWHDGVQMRGKTFASIDEAEDHLRRVGREKRRGTYEPDSPATVAEIVAAYIARGADRWTGNTVATYSLLARKQIAPHLGTVRMTALTTPKVQAWIDRLTASGLSAAVIENARTVLGGACKEAMRMGMIAANPVAGTRIPTRPRASKTTWTPEQAGRVLATLADDVHWRGYYLVALTTGMRPGELRALQWQDVDFDAGIITVRRTMTRDAAYHHRIGETTKTKRTRSIAVPAETLDALRAVRADQRRRQIAAEHWHDLGMVFDRGDGNPHAQQTVANVHTRVCARAGVPRCRMHDLRHAAATMMLANGVHPKVVADILGHSSIATTLDIYSHPDVSLQRAASEGLAEAIIRKRKA